jgi:hypothetical protein
MERIVLLMVDHPAHTDDGMDSVSGMEAASHIQA